MEGGNCAHDRQIPVSNLILGIIRLETLNNRYAVVEGLLPRGVPGNCMPSMEGLQNFLVFRLVFQQQQPRINEGWSGKHYMGINAKSP